MNPSNAARNLAVKLALVVGATALFYAAFFGVQPLLRAVLSRMPENFEHLARTYLQRGQYDKALEVCEREIARYAYNFHAHYLRAEILRATGRNEEALETLWRLPELRRAILRRPNVPSRGWDEARVHLLLAQVLWDLGRWEQSLDQLQLAVDWRDPKIDALCESFVAQIGRKGDDRSAPWAYIARVIVDPSLLNKPVPERDLFKRVKAPAHFFARMSQIAVGRGLHALARAYDSKEVLYHPRDLVSLMSHRFFVESVPLPPGVAEPARRPELDQKIARMTVGSVVFDSATTGDTHIAQGHWLRLFRTCVVAGKAKLREKSKGVCIIARGTICNNVWPIVSIRLGDRVVGQRYIRSEFYQAYALPLVLEPGEYSISVGFENDAYNPIARRDRNLEIKEIRFY